MRFAGGAAAASSGAGQEARTVDEDIGGAVSRWLTTTTTSCRVWSSGWCLVRSRSAAVEANEKPECACCTARTCAGVRAAWERSLGCAPQPLRLVARDFAPQITR